MDEFEADLLSIVKQRNLYEYMEGYIFLGILIIFSLVTIWVNRKRNAWDILFFNSTSAILTLFMIGILAGDLGVWKIIVVALGAVAVGEKIARFFFTKNGE
ncbi:MAG: hypothetical protein A3C84_04185 [Candidatus Ryanbacteria bacterium RIFCSPHIGHO2_02_FULL_48_12]|uniref:Uncharacterized protein n=1 Tax=Candidatus Ryanbacteria bacterium RIFCSPHIGHO2_01_FULL_48_27 TaxID=1802115 RepID=A0A1G2G5Q5_9BACT|nr:MAG: hypothetical protein A2756_00770 [Candidatus Ryanbacteria bacterium RIFCSPHIGHO2_01_FULL_48_27]OGZ48562.1 MAG: hypothetical protein A3C84_04185 [Candidatus Ryanbacteria bacterium RIFCSPHIGHO2_02_FULL_48_12]